MPVHVIDWLTGIASFGVKFIGYPTQMRRNMWSGRAGAGSSLAPTLAAAFFVSYTLWVIHGLAHHDMVEVVSQGIGVLTTGVLLAQAVWYERLKRRLEAGIERA